MQRTILARDEITAPYLPAISEIDVSWRIVSGNAADLLKAVDMFAGGDRQKTLHLWQSAKTNGYHWLVIRLFHNFLSSAAAHLAHLKRRAALCKRHASVVYDEFAERDLTLRRERLDLLVAFLIPVLNEIEAKLKTARSAEKAERLSAQLQKLRALGDRDHFEVSSLVQACLADLDSHRLRLRHQLLDVYQTLSCDLPRWATDADRPEVERYVAEHPPARPDGATDTPLPES
jgi:hypothetical protein